MCVRQILQPLDGERGGGTDCVYLSAFNNRLGHKHFDLHVGVVLRPAVVLSHCSVVAVGLGLKVLLRSETNCQIFCVFIPIRSRRVLHIHTSVTRHSRWFVTQNHLDTCR